MGGGGARTRTVEPHCSEVKGGRGRGVGAGGGGDGGRARERKMRVVGCRPP